MSVLPTEDKRNAVYTAIRQYLIENEVDEQTATVAAVEEATTLFYKALRRARFIVGQPP
jgi:hypothetical protein